jgi:hypothetical protein
MIPYGIKKAPVMYTNIGKRGKINISHVHIAYRAIKNLPTTDDQSTSRSWYEPSVPDYYIILCATIMGRYDTGHTKASSIHQHSCKLAHKDPPSSLPLKALTSSSSSLSLSLSLLATVRRNTVSRIVLLHCRENIRPLSGSSLLRSWLIQTCT